MSGLGVLLRQRVRLHHSQPPVQRSVHVKPVAVPLMQNHAKLVSREHKGVGMTSER